MHSRGRRRKRKKNRRWKGAREILSSLPFVRSAVVSLSLSSPLFPPLSPFSPLPSAPSTDGPLSSGGTSAVNK